MATALLPPLLPPAAHTSAGAHPPAHHNHHHHSYHTKRRFGANFPTCGRAGKSAHCGKTLHWTNATLTPGYGSSIGLGFGLGLGGVVTDTWTCCTGGALTMPVHHGIVPVNIKKLQSGHEARCRYNPRCTSRTSGKVCEVAVRCSWKGGWAAGRVGGWAAHRGRRRSQRCCRRGVMPRRVAGGCLAGRAAFFFGPPGAARAPCLAAGRSGCWLRGWQQQPHRRRHVLSSNLRPLSLRFGQKLDLFDRPELERRVPRKGPLHPPPPRCAHRPPISTNGVDKDGRDGRDGYAGGRWLRSLQPAASCYPPVKFFCTLSSTVWLVHS
jgi:hypothetical protein